MNCLLLVFFFLAFVGSIFSQKLADTGSKPLAIINSAQFFDSKTGIPELIAAVAPLEKEFASDQLELNTLAAKYQELSTRLIEKAERRKAFPHGDYDSLHNEIDQIRLLECEIISKQSRAKKRFDSRRMEVTAFVQFRISDALERFGRQRGYLVILDVAKLDNGAFVLADVSYPDLTSEFVAYFSNQSKKGNTKSK